MAKALNQNFFTSILYGSEVAGSTLRLDSSLTSTKGIVQVAATSLDLIIGSSTGSFIHSNTAYRTYTLPDVSGTVLTDGLFTSAYQILYSLGANSTGVLNTTVASILATSLTGAPNWISGSNGQFLQIVAGAPSFAALPSTVGSIASSVGNTLSVYQSPGPSNSLVPLTTVANSALLSPSGTLTWGLITASYLSGSGNAPLGSGTAGQKLKSNGDGTFVWANDSSLIDPGTQYYMAYYSAPATGSQIDASSFVQVDEVAKALKLLNGGKLRVYESTSNGVFYVELKAPTSLGASLSFTLPAADGASGSFLTTDGLGNLSFVAVNSGVVSSGLANQIAVYASSGSTVKGLTTVSNSVLLSPSGTLTWSLITASYLATIGNVSLGNGSTNNVLISNGDGTFSWATVASLSGIVSTGSTSQAAYYASSGTTVSPSSFVNFVDASKRLDLTNGGILRLYQPTVSGTNYLDFKVPTSLSSSTSFTLPPADGTLGYALTTNGLGVLSFSEVGSGNVLPGSANELAYYTGSNTLGGKGIVSPFTNVATRAMLTNSLNAVTWGLITEPYLSAGSSTPLSGGQAGQILTSDGSGNFAWENIGSLAGSVNAGASGYLTYYASSGTTVSASSFLFEQNAELHLTNHGQIRFYEATNTFYTGFIAAASQAVNVLWTLPATDASSSGQVLVSNAAGVLSFQDQVLAGTTNALAFYSSSARQVSPTTTVTYLGSSFNFTGSAFSFIGASGSTPTSFSLLAGAGTSAQGGSITINAGSSSASSYGQVSLGIGSASVLSLQNLNPGLYVNIFGAALRLYEPTSTNYVGFQAPTTPTNVVWKLPSSDGSSGQVLYTDGSGNLSWKNVSASSVGTGTANALAYYSTTTNVTSSPLLLPAGLPVSAGQALISDSFGQLSYQNLVSPGATIGYVGVYSAAQTIGYSPNLSFSSNALQLNNQSNLYFYEPTVAGSAYVALQAPAAIPASYTLQLPTAPPAVGNVLAALSATQLGFVDIIDQPSLEQRGSVVVPSGANQVTILYDTIFSAQPANILALWSIEGISSIATLPTIAVSLSTTDGFVLVFSTTTTQSYTLYWQAYLNGDASLQAGGYLAGGDSAGTFVSTFSFLAFDSDTTSLLALSSFSTLRAYSAGVSSLLAGYIMGGSSNGTSSLTTISSLTFSSQTLVDLTQTLITPRSGAAGIGNRSNGLVAGGTNLGVGILTSIENFTFATSTSVTQASILTGTAHKRGAANNTTEGVVVHGDSTSTVDIVSLISDSVAAGPNNFGVSNMQVGCNSIANGTGYFGQSTGALWSYQFSGDTITALALTLNSTTGLSVAFNSMVNGYFAGTSVIDRFNFATSTITQVNTIGVTTPNSDSIASFQTNGLL